MLTKIEKTLVLIGVVSMALLLVELVYWDQIPFAVREFFRGGNTGGVIIGGSILCGLIGMVLFPINVIFKHRKRWWLRLFLILLLLVEMSVVGSMV